MKNKRIVKHHSESSKASFVAQGDFIYRHKPTPIFINAKRSTLEDNKGYRYLNADAANGTANLGFDASILKESWKKVEKIPSMPSFCETELRLQVAKRIANLFYKAIGERGKVAFELGGAQGVELAIKVVKSNQRKSQFVVFEGGYHGRSIFTSQLSASHRYRSFLGDWRIPVIRLPYPDSEYSAYYKDEKTFVNAALDFVDRITDGEIGGIVTNQGEADIAALIVEPVLNAGGIVKPPKLYLEAVVKRFRELGALIVVDEIFCGFHRTGPMFGFEHYDFIPDIVILSKALTNGLAPLSCVWARNPYMTPGRFPPGTHSSTFANNTLSLAIADTVLDRYMEWKNIRTDISLVEQRLSEMIKVVVKKFPWVKSGYAIGALGRVVLQKKIAGQINDLAMTIARNNPVKGFHGAILASTGLSPHILAINPPLTITQNELDALRILLIRTFMKAKNLL